MPSLHTRAFQAVPASRVEAVQVVEVEVGAPAVEEADAEAETEVEAGACALAWRERLRLCPCFCFCFCFCPCPWSCPRSDQSAQAISPVTLYHTWTPRAAAAISSSAPEAPTCSAE
eukprot:CAMPEP_0173181632 /NCGR_PEP_ID=MMETSP1141-20130122/7383_1 /TAXON_ID=483371 /ORGANISM="non described non described, Strain CCMP2298" /LENGTH=115 /DNA_ID=CAMNT_0014104623 /DNA_START=702 /DNA_END=1049 /DNA_ORIENTATION=+